MNSCWLFIQIVKWAISIQIRPHISTQKGSTIPIATKPRGYYCSWQRWANFFEKNISENLHISSQEKKKNVTAKEHTEKNPPKNRNQPGFKGQRVKIAPILFLYVIWEKWAENSLRWNFAFLTPSKIVFVSISPMIFDEFNLQFGVDGFRVLILKFFLYWKGEEKLILRSDFVWSLLAWFFMAYTC